MGNIRIIALIAFIGLVIVFMIAVPSGKAMVTNGFCSGEMIYLGGSCNVFGHLDSGDRNYSYFYLADVDENPPYQAEIKISAFWDNPGVYGYDEIVQAGNTYTYINPSDSNDFVRFTVDAIFVGGDIDAVEFGDVDYQQTFYVSTGGSDSNYGNVPSNAWGTVGNAASVLVDGTDVIVGSGIYYGLTIGSSEYNGVGLVNAPIIFKGDGNYPVLRNTTSGYIVPINLQQPRYIDISGFDIRNNYPDGFYRDCIIELSDGPSVYLRDISIHDNLINSFGGVYGIDFGVGSTHIENFLIYNNTFSGNYPARFGGTSFVNDLVYNNTFLTSNLPLMYTNIFKFNSGTIGNYWSLYMGIDANGDKIGDTPMETGTNDDLYPKMDCESGYVKYSNGTAVQNATVQQTSATYRNTTSDANGYYALSTIGRDTVNLYAFKDSNFGNATVAYDSSNANITIGVSGYNNTNTIRFSSDINPANEINHSAIDTFFWANVWIQDYDPDHDYYSVRVYYPNGDLKDPDINASDAQPAQKQYKINSNEDYGNYLFISHSYYFNEDLANNSILIHNASDVNDSVHNCNCIDHCTPGYFVSTRFCINPYADYASMYFSSDLSGLNRITSALFNHTVYLQISHPNGDYTNHSYNISILTPTSTPFYNWTTTTEYGYASWYTPSIATGTWMVNFIRKNLSDSSELVMNTTTLYLSQDVTPPPVNLSVISGYVRETGSLNPIYQASIVAGSYSASSNAIGYYIISNMLDGNYTITASKTGYNSSSTTRTIANGSISNVNFILNCTGACPTPTPTGTPTVTPTPTGTGGGITPGSTTDATIASNFWTILFIVICLYGITFFWTIGDKE